MLEEASSEPPGIAEARSAIRAAKNKVEDTRGWLSNLLKRGHSHIAAVAWANKNVRNVCSRTDGPYLILL